MHLLFSQGLSLGHLARSTESQQNSDTIQGYIINSGLPSPQVWDTGYFSKPLYSLQRITLVTMP